MVGKRKYDIDFKVRLSNELKDTLRDTATQLEISESDVIRMLIRNLKTKGIVSLS